MCRNGIIFASLAILLLCVCAGNWAQAQQPSLSILYNFGQPAATPDGWSPEGSPFLADNGNYYGTTYQGGKANLGTVYELTPAGVETIIHSFGDGTVPGDGENPVSGLVEDSIFNLYGATNNLATGVNSVFKISSGGLFSVLVSLPGPCLGPLVIGSDGNIYGTTTSISNGGTAFKLTPAGILTTLHTFGGQSANDGAQPNGGLVFASNGDMYGTTGIGGTANSGTVFQLTTAGQETVLHSFGDGSVTGDGETPKAGLVLGPNGNLYSTTVNGGNSGVGTLYEITTAGAVTILHSFESFIDDGFSPLAGVFFDSSGNLYGTTDKGGSIDDGTIYKMTSTGTYSVLHSFRDGGVTNDGAYPTGTLIQSAGSSFYFLTSEGGANGDGAVQSITSTGTVSLVHSFDATAVPNDGLQPTTALTQFADGNFYFTTSYGGSVGSGAVYKMTSAHVISQIYSFCGGSTPYDGIDPVANVIEGSDHNIYGTTAGGGTVGAGTVYKLTPAGTMTILHSFQDGSVANDGQAIVGSLLQASDGNFYGTTEGGGTALRGTVFRITPSGSETILHSFGDGSVTDDGTTPEAGLIQGSDGNLYGTTTGGGANSAGTVFNISLTGTVTILHSFGAEGDGSSSVAPLIQGPDSNYYGVCYSDPIFQLTPNDDYNLIYDSPTTDTGFSPQAGLTDALDGGFFGTNRYGGSVGYGTIFNVSPFGVFTVLHTFGDGTVPNDGEGPASSVTQGPDGNSYGTTSEGGVPLSYGTVYELFTQDPVPALTQISPTSAVVDSSNLTLTLSGFDFSTRSIAYFGTTALQTNYVSSIQLDAIVPASLLTVNGTFQVEVKTPTPGGGTSAQQTFSVDNPSPTTSSLSPNPVFAEETANLTIKGTHFTSTSVVNWNGTPVSTTYVSSTELTAQVPGSLVKATGSASVTVTNPLPGGGTSGKLTIGVINPIPTQSSLSPGTVAVGDPGFTLTVNGAGFDKSTVVKWAGNALSTTFVSATQVQAQVPSDYLNRAGKVAVVATNPTPGGGVSGTKSVTILLTTLSVSVTGLERTSNVVDVTIKITDNGLRNAFPVNVTSSVLGGIATTTTLPVKLGGLKPGNSISTTLAFAGEPGSGEGEIFSVAGTSNAGAFSGTTAVVLP